MNRRTSASRIGTLRILGSRRAFARTGLFAFIVAFLLVGSPASTLALEDGEYTMQCVCSVSWEGEWDGNGVFDEGESLDTIAVTNGTAVVLIHELPIDAMSLEDFIEGRTESLEDNPNIEDAQVVWDDESEFSLTAGRSWVNADGDTVLSWQYVRVWEEDYLLSMEFITLEDEFEDTWFSILGDVRVGGANVNRYTDGDEVMENFGL